MEDNSITWKGKFIQGTKEFLDYSCHRYLDVRTSIFIDGLVGGMFLSFLLDTDEKCQDTSFTGTFFTISLLHFLSKIAAQSRVVQSSNYSQMDAGKETLMEGRISVFSVSSSNIWSLYGGVSSGCVVGLLRLPWTVWFLDWNKRRMFFLRMLSRATVSLVLSYLSLWWAPENCSKLQPFIKATSKKMHWVQLSLWLSMPPIGRASYCKKWAYYEPVGSF